jgi:hypothetical protein
MIPAILLAWLMERIILNILFYLVVTPTSLLVKLSGKGLLNRNFNSTAQSYWIPSKATAPDKWNYENQF